MCTSARHKVSRFFSTNDGGDDDKQMLHTWNITAGADGGCEMLNLAPNHSDNWFKEENATAENFRSLNHRHDECTHEKPSTPD